MAFYPPPDEVLPIFNPVNFQTQANTGDEDIPFLTQYFLRYPTSQGSEVVAGTLVAQGQLTADTNIVMDGTAGTNYLEFPDGSQQFTSATSSSSGSALLSSANTWTNSNDFSAGSKTTTASAGTNNNLVANTEFVNTAITNALTPITPSQPITETFTLTNPQTLYYTIPANAYGYTWSLIGLGGLAGESVYVEDPATGDAYLQLGGQGGGAGTNWVTPTDTNPNNIGLESSLLWSGETLTMTCNTSHTTISCGVLAGIYIAQVGNGGVGANSALRTNNLSPVASVGGVGGTAGTGGSFGGAQVGFAVGASGAPSGSAVNLATTPSLSVPYANLNPPIASPYTGGGSIGDLTGSGVQFPTGSMTSGQAGTGQLFQEPTNWTSGSGVSMTIGDQLTTNPYNYKVFGDSPIGTAQFVITTYFTNPTQLGGTNASFIAYDDPDPVLKTKQIYTDKEGLVVSQDLTGSYKTTTLTPTNLTQDLNSVVSTALIADIITFANAGTPDLSAVLTAGNTATNSIALDNTGTGTNVISLLPNASAGDPHITLTDGTTTNTINKSGYTTRNSVQNSTHYINFSDASTTGTGAIQKTAGISCNPSTNIITATTFVGSLTGTADNATNVITTADNTSTTYAVPFCSTTAGAVGLKIDPSPTPLTYTPDTGTLTATSLIGGLEVVDTAINATYYPTFVEEGGTGQVLRCDKISTPNLTYNPFNSVLTATTFAGSLTGTADNATNATNVLITTDNTAGTYYPTFVKTGTTGNKPLFMDDGTFPLTYNPSTATLTTTQFAGLASQSSTSTITDTNTNATYYPTFVSAAGVGQSLRADIGTGPFSYNPNTGTLAVVNLAGGINITETNTSGTYYPTFVSAAGSGASLRADTSTTAFSYNPSTNALEVGSSLTINGSGGNGKISIGQTAVTSQGNSAIAIGTDAGKNSQGGSGIAIGINAGKGLSPVFQGSNAVAIGVNAGENGQGQSSVLIGPNAGQGTTSACGNNTICIGSNAGQASAVAGSICINASGTATNPAVAGCFIRPIRGVALGIGVGRVFYDTATFELQYSTT